MVSRVTGVNMSYGDYDFRPVPMVTISRESYKTSTTTIGGVYTISLNGTLIPYAGGGEDGPIGVFDAKTELLSVMRADFGCFEATFTGIDCGKIVLNGRPKVQSISFDTSSDNTSRTMPYSIELSFAGSSLKGIEDYIGLGLDLESISTSYNISYIDKPYRFQDEVHGPRAELGRTITAKGLAVGIGAAGLGCYPADDVGGGTGFDPGATGMMANTGVYIDPLVAAMDYIALVVGTGAGTNGKALNIPAFAQESGIFMWEAQTSGLGTNTFLTDRTLDIDEHDGSVTLNDTFLLFPTGTGYQTTIFPVTDSFSINVDSEITEGVIKVSTQGSIVGYPNYKVDSLLVQDGSGAFENASGYFATGLIGSGDQAHFFGRCSGIYAGTLSANMLAETADSQMRGGPSPVQIAGLNSQPISRSYGYNIKEGTIDYSLSYSNRPEACLSGANVLSEQISLTRNRPTPLHASLTVLGRASGPILQDIGTQTAYTADLSIEAVVIPPPTCPEPDWLGGAPDYDPVVSGTEKSIDDAGNAYFRTTDNESFDVKTGRYTRNVSWVYTLCPS